LTRGALDTLRATKRIDAEAVAASDPGWLFAHRVPLNDENRFGRRPHEDGYALYGDRMGGHAPVYSRIMLLAPLRSPSLTPSATRSCLSNPLACLAIAWRVSVNERNLVEHALQLGAREGRLLNHGGHRRRIDIALHS
jgi:hypothetical protein